MKKILFLTIILVAAVALALPQVAEAADAWADETYVLGDGGGEAAQNATYELSSNVYLYYTADATNVNYGLGSLHKSGNRSYATSNTTTLIYWNPKSAGETADSDAEVTAGATNPGGTPL